MAYNFRAVERDRLYLMPPSVTDWLEEDHLAFFVLDTSSCVRSCVQNGFWNEE
jgi:hypothetical protein